MTIAPYILIWVISNWAGNAITSGSQVLADKGACERARVEMKKQAVQNSARVLALFCTVQRTGK
jgi:hypothetical protein